jgi:hypothetical protein
MSIFQTPFTPGFEAPSGEGSGVSSRGGAELGEGTQKESSNLSGLPSQPDTYTIGPGDPGKGATIPLPDLTTSRTIHTGK